MTTNKVVVELTLKQLDDLLSNRVSQMKPVIEYIRDNVQDVEDYIPDLADLDMGELEDEG
ncbi:MAG: hypothetical protein WC444_06195 [Candidatus Paceibacterota bacterium]